MKYKKGYPLIEFDSWNGTYYVESNPDSIGRIISKRTALKLAKTKRYYFQESNRFHTSKLISKTKCYKEVKGWIKNS
jgi:hypothetical protein